MKTNSDSKFHAKNQNSLGFSNRNVPHKKFKTFALFQDILNYYKITEDNRSRTEITIGIIQRKNRRRIANYDAILTQCRT